MEEKSQGQEKINSCFHFVWSQESTIWPLLGGTGVLCRRRPGAPRGEVGCTVNRAQREGTRSHSSFIVFLVRGFHVTRRARGLDAGGEAQEMSRDGEGTAAEGGTGRRRVTTEPVAGQPRQSLADVGSHRLCFKQENNLMV